MKSLRYVLFVLAVSCFAQSTQQAFDNAYWLSQPPEVQACAPKNGAYSPANAAGPCTDAQAAALASSGYRIFAPIAVWAWDPWTTMNVLQSLGYSWAPAVGQTPIGANPGYAAPRVPPQPGQSAYPSTPPAGTILVSTTVSDYPPYSPPAPAVVPATAFSLGPQIFGGEYILIENGTTPFPPVGSKLTVGSVTGTVVQVGPFGYGLQASN